MIHTYTQTDHGSIQPIPYGSLWAPTLLSGSGRSSLTTLVEWSDGAQGRHCLLRSAAPQPLHYTVLYYSILYYMLYYAILYYTILYYTEYADLLILPPSPHVGARNSKRVSDASPQAYTSRWNQHIRGQLEVPGPDSIWFPRFPLSGVSGLSVKELTDRGLLAIFSHPGFSEPLLEGASWGWGFRFHWFITSAESAVDVAEVRRVKFEGLSIYYLLCYYCYFLLAPLLWYNITYNHIT